MNQEPTKGFVDRAFWVLALALGAYVSDQIKGLNGSVILLSEKMAVITERMLTSQQRIDMIEKRVHELERPR